jgi:hypothetical protein
LVLIKDGLAGFSQSFAANKLKKIVDEQTRKALIRAGLIGGALAFAGATSARYMRQIYWRKFDGETY